MKMRPPQKKIFLIHYHDQVLKRIQMSKNVTGVMVMNQDGMPVIIIFITITITDVYILATSGIKLYFESTHFCVQ